jgi:hypothetical protein
MRALCHEGVGQVHGRGPMATNTSGNSRTALSTVRVCRVRVVTNGRSWMDRMSALLLISFFFRLFFLFMFYFVFFLLFSPLVLMSVGMRLP